MTDRSIDFAGEPDIADNVKAALDGFRTAGRPGCVPPRAKPLKEKLEFESQFGRSTCVTVRKWR